MGFTKICFQANSAEAMISGDSIFGIEEVKHITGTNELLEQVDSRPITRVDGESRRTRVIDERDIEGNEFNS
jgi:hypothetical protein